MSNWTISGEDGKKLGTQRVSLAALGIESPKLHLGSMEDEKFTFSQTFQTPRSAGVDGFDQGQIIELWQDDVRRFRGHFLFSEPSDSGVGFSVSRTIIGLWWWMRNTPLTGIVQDGNGDDTDRAIMVFPNGDVAGHLSTVFDRAIKLGVPMQKGSIDPCYDIPQITLKQKSCADALGELLGRVPDAVMEVDYSAVGMPRVNIRRRGAMETLTYTYGQPPLVSASARSRLDQKASEVKVTYLTRDETTGVRIIAEQIAGADDGALPARQIISVSGEELGALVPDPDETQIVQSRSLSNLSTVAEAVHPQVIGVEDEYPGDVDILAWPDTGVSLWSGTSSSSSNVTQTTSHKKPDLDVFSAETGEAVPMDYYLTKGELQPWFEAAGIATRRLVVRGYFYHKTIDTTDTPDWLLALGWDDLIAGYSSWVIGSDFLRYYVKYLEFEVIGVDQNWATDTTIYEPAEYSFILPPADFAENLRLAQNWTPYDGRIVLTGRDVIGSPLLNKTYNLDQHMPEYATMRAMAKSIDLDIFNGSTTINLGPPARQSLKGSVNRVQQSDEDNIVYA